MERFPKTLAIMDSMVAAGATGGHDEAHKAFFESNENKAASSAALRELYDSQYADCIIIVAREKGFGSEHMAAAMEAFLLPMSKRLGYDIDRIITWFHMAYQQEIDSLLEIQGNS